MQQQLIIDSPHIVISSVHVILFMHFELVIIVTYHGDTQQLIPNLSKLFPPAAT